MLFAFKLDDETVLIKECRPIVIDLFGRILIQLQRIVSKLPSVDITEDKKRTINGYYSLALHILAILKENEDENNDPLYGLVEQLARIPLTYGSKVFLALAEANPKKCEGIDVVDWNAVGSVSKTHLADAAKRAFRVSFAQFFV